MHVTVYLSDFAREQWVWHHQCCTPHIWEWEHLSLWISFFPPLLSLISGVLLLSLDAHNHVHDYSGTLGGVLKTKKQKVLKLLHHLKFLLKNKTPSWLVSGRWLRQKCQQSSPLLHPWSWRESSSPWWCTVNRNHLCTVFWWWWGISCWQCWATYIYKCLLTPLVGLSSRLRFCLLAFLLRVQGNRLQNKLLHHFCFYFCCIIIIQIYSHGLSGQTVSANLAAH